MKKIAILSSLMLLAGNVAFASVTVDTQPTSLVTSPMTVGASSDPVGLMSFALTGGAGETLTDVIVTLNAAPGSSVSGSDIDMLAVYMDDNGNGTFKSATDQVAGSQADVNLGSETTIALTSNNDLDPMATFFVTIETDSTWSGSDPVDSVRATIDTDGIETSADSPTVTAVTTSYLSAVAADETGPELTTAVGQNTGGSSAKEAGDRVVLTFDEATEKPTINASNIDTVLDLDNGHSWKDGDGEIGSATWNSAGTLLTVVLSDGTSVPTVTVGDEVTVMGSVIQDSDDNDATGDAVISGSFTEGSEETGPELTTAAAQNAGGTSAKEAGDRVVLTFDEATNKTTINAANIDAVLDLNNSHSFRDGDGEIGSASWNSAGTVLTIVLSDGTSLPTVAVGDEVTVVGSVIQDADDNDATGDATISGSFTSGTVDDDDEDGDSEDGEGKACANVLVNGRLYKVKGSENTTVYLAAACRLKPFRGAAVFHARGNKFQNIIELDSLTGFEVSDKPALPAAGTLIKGSDKTVWFIKTGHKRKGFSTEAAFTGLGFKFSQVNQITDDDLNTMEVDSDTIDDATEHPDGSLIKCSGSATVFQIIGKKKFPFTDISAFALRGHSFEHVANVECGRWNYVQGTLITTTP